MAYGFNRSYNGRHATVYGKGAYFAKIGNFSYAGQSTYAKIQANGMQQLVLAKVLEGARTVGKATDLEPPYMDTVTKVRFDTTGDAQNTIIVTYRDQQAYPAYLVTFKRRQKSVVHPSHYAPYRSNWSFNVGGLVHSTAASSPTFAALAFNFNPSAANVQSSLPPPGLHPPHSTSTASWLSFIPANKFSSSKPGMVFKMGVCGLGYYRDSHQTVFPGPGGVASGAQNVPVKSANIRKP